jgi:hypothetical protein
LTRRVLLCILLRILRFFYGLCGINRVSIFIIGGLFRKKSVSILIKLKFKSFVGMLSKLYRFRLIYFIFSPEKQVQMSSETN